jgi:hypothetical protein
MIYRALVVTGLIADVDAFEARMASERRPQAARPLAKKGAVTPNRWRTKSAIRSLRPLLRLLERLPRREPPPALPRISGSHLESRMETIDGKLRLEYSFAAAGPLVAIRLVSGYRCGTAVPYVCHRRNKSPWFRRETFLMSATGGEQYRLPVERRQIHVRRAIREWRDISPRIASTEAADAILRETAARWDLRLADNPMCQH